MVCSLLLVKFEVGLSIGFEKRRTTVHKKKLEFKTDEFLKIQIFITATNPPALCVLLTKHLFCLLPACSHNGQESTKRISYNKREHD
jgi:hypothetical protein